MDLGLKGRTALVMGASQGLGQATAMQLAEEGAHVILVARREDVLISVQQQIEDAGGSAEVACCDLFDRASRQALCQLIENLRVLTYSWPILEGLRLAWHQGLLQRFGPKSSTRWCWD